MSLPRVPTDSSNEKQHRTIIASTVNELVKLRQPNDATKEEAAAGVTPIDPRYVPLPRIDLRRYGLSASATGETNRRALEQALDVASQLGGAVLQAPPGTFVIDATVTIDVDNTIIEGQGQGATVWSFNPGSADVLFDFTKGASSIVRSGIRSCGFFSNNTNTKTAIQINDGRQCIVEHIAINDGNWPGSGSIGVRTYGRDFFKFRYCDIECARPYIVSANPNFATIHVDMSEVQYVQFATTETTGKNVEVETGVEISNWRFLTCNFARGKYGFFWDDTTTTIASFKLAFINCRTEQADDDTGYSFYIASTAQNLQDLYFENCHVDPGMNGLYCRKVQRITLNNSTFVGGSGITNLDITFESGTELRLHNTLVQTASTVTLTNGVLVEGTPFTTATSAIPRSAVYRYDEGAIISQKLALGMNGLRYWRYEGSLANNGTINTPITRALFSSCHIVVTAYSATGPVKAGGSAVWFTDGTTTKVGGTANFVVAAAGAEIRCLDGGSGLVVVNTLGQTVKIGIYVSEAVGI
jgi:hypothetical protein